MIKIKGKKYIWGFINRGNKPKTGKHSKETTQKPTSVVKKIITKIQEMETRGSSGLWNSLGITQIPVESIIRATQESAEKQNPSVVGVMSQRQAMKSRGLLNPPFLFMYCLGEDGARVSPESREIRTKIPRGGWECSSVATGSPTPKAFDQKKGRKAPS